MPGVVRKYGVEVAGGSTMGISGGCFRGKEIGDETLTRMVGLRT